LSLVARNAERHADNPAFRADMVATLQNSVGKMNDLLARLAQHNTGRADHLGVVDLVALLRQVVTSKQHAYPEISLNSPQLILPVMGDAGRLEQLFTHLIQNAVDASHDHGVVLVNICGKDENVMVTIDDLGVGMSAHFIRNDLFRPFRSTKVGGFGIGAYEAREIARDHHGSLDVASREGEGSRFTIQLPLHSGTATGGME
jgi:signal transduction histidine kinase